MLLTNMQITKSLIRLRKCVGWSAPLLFAYPSPPPPEDMFFTSWSLSIFYIYEHSVFVRSLLPNAAYIEFVLKQSRLSYCSDIRYSLSNLLLYYYSLAHVLPQYIVTGAICTIIY